MTYQKRISKKKFYEKRRRAYIKKVLLVVLLSLVLFVAVARCEEAVPTLSDASRAFHLARFAKMAEMNNAEIARRHEMQIEVAKHQVAMDLQAAGASEVNVSASAVASNVTRVKNSNDVIAESA